MEIAKWKGYKFKKSRKLDSWLKYGWGMLFRRSMTDFDIKQLKHFLDKRFWIDIKEKTGDGLTIREESISRQYIGADGYIYMNKQLYREPWRKWQKETNRLEKLMEKAKEEREVRYLEYEKRHLEEMARTAYIKNYFYVTADGKIRRRF
tara:strand:- start:99 stop:545 length:447 start_codon:yes stop_codon:yes gene_type:complete